MNQLLKTNGMKLKDKEFIKYVEKKVDKTIKKYKLLNKREHAKHLNNDFWFNKRKNQLGCIANCSLFLSSKVFFGIEKLWRLF